MARDHGCEIRCSHDVLSSAVCWHCLLEELLGDDSFLTELRRVAACVLGDEADVEEVLQAVWLKVLERKPELTRGKEPRAYVKKMVSGTALDRRKERATRDAAGGETTASDVARDPEPFELAALHDVSKDLVPLVERFLDAPTKSRARRRLYQEILALLLEHKLIDHACYERVRHHRPDLRARSRASTVDVPARALSVE